MYTFIYYQTVFHIRKNHIFIHLPCLLFFQLRRGLVHLKSLKKKYIPVANCHYCNIGSYIRSWERPGDLPRVIEMLCLFASGAQRNEREDTTISITSGRSPGLSQQRMQVPISSVNQQLSGTGKLRNEKKRNETKRKQNPTKSVK